METVVFESRLLPDGHLYCPEEFVKNKNIRFKVVVIFEKIYPEATDRDIEQAAIHDVSDESLSDEEINYYLNLKEL
jgi:hypothetical protein